MPRDVALLGDGKDAAGGGYAVVANDHGAIVQGAVFEKDILYQRMADVGIDDHACRGDVIQVVVAGDEDEGTLFDVRHVLACLDDRVDVEVDVASDLKELELVKEPAFLCLRSYGE